MTLHYIFCWKTRYCEKALVHELKFTRQVKTADFCVRLKDWGGGGVGVEAGEWERQCIIQQTEWGFHVFNHFLNNLIFLIVKILFHLKLSFLFFKKREINKVILYRVIKSDCNCVMLHNLSQHVELFTFIFPSPSVMKHLTFAFNATAENYPIKQITEYNVYRIDWALEIFS